MEKLQQKLDFLLEKYSVNKDVQLNTTKSASIDGVSFPLLSQRSERRFIELKSIVSNGTLEGISVMRTSRIIENGSDIFEALYREFDICQFVLGRIIKTVTAMQNDNVLNVIAKTDDGVVCTIELAATLKNGEKPKDKHEIIAQRGTACDIVVDAQLKQDSIYVFGNENKKYTDVDFELYGLEETEIAIVRAAFNAAKGDNLNELLDIQNNLLSLVKATHLSIKNGRRENV